MTAKKQCTYQHFKLSEEDIHARKIKIHKLGAALATAGILATISVGTHAADQTFTLATSASETDMRSVDA